MIDLNRHLQEQKPSQREVYDFITENFGGKGGQGVYVLELGPLEDIEIRTTKIRSESRERFKESLKDVPDGLKIIDTGESRKVVDLPTKEEKEVKIKKYIFEGTFANHKFLQDLLCIYHGPFPRRVEKAMEHEKVIYVGSFSSSSPHQRIMTHIRSNPILPQTTASDLTTAFKIKKIRRIEYCEKEPTMRESEIATRLREENDDWYVHFW